MTTMAAAATAKMMTMGTTRTAGVIEMEMTMKTLRKMTTVRAAVAAWTEMATTARATTRTMTRRTTKTTKMRARGRAPARSTAAYGRAFGPARSAADSMR